jgi:ATP-dependent Clp protease ATP-binding subunit ClpB
MALDFNKWTVKAGEALQTAQSLAAQYNHQEIDVEHLLLALLQQNEGTTTPLLQKLEATPARCCAKPSRNWRAARSRWASKAGAL